MKTICKTYQNTITPKKWMIALTGVSYLLISLILYIRPFSDVYTMTTVFGLILLPSSFLEIYISSGNREKIFSWGFSFLNAIADLFMAMLFMAHAHLDNTTIVYFGSFWILGKGMVTLNFSSLIRKHRIVKFIYLISSLITIVLSMLLIINTLFSEIKVDVIIMIALLLCAFNKFMSVVLLHKNYY
ncbi:hypothetical protein [Flammeovirga sp. SJP92]|uniref:hypothetical protein n=1 Tax=Flammeovirga sp. SJP92 TaxID=1775430 RepID=UPI0007886C61|nr:hypothetical protein [Flammeovirga sp. SJP92]KXX70212.1 hypothetical protein AVL50_15215 [Flammeovirga sp. SJP92]